MKRKLLIIGILFLIVFVGFKIYKFSQKVVRVINEPYKPIEIVHKYRAEVFFDDPKVIEFCKSLEKGDFKRADELLKEGVDINTRGKRGMTPFLWVTRHAIMADRPDDKKQAFKYFLQKKANPLKIAEIEGKFKDSYYPQTVLHYVAELKDPWYLKELLESGLIKKDDIDFEKEEKGWWQTATLTAELTDRFENFKMLLDYGADVNWKNKSGLTLLERALTDWRFTYELLKRGVDFKNIGTNNGKSMVTEYTEDLNYSPSTSLNYRGADYRQKVIQFLENHGITDIHPYMPEDEKYVKENGKYQLYINEGFKDGKRISNEDHWVKFEDSHKYNPEYKNGDGEESGYEERQQKPINYSFKKDFPYEE